jgi:hypothetical protein
VDWCSARSRGRDAGRTTRAGPGWSVRSTSTSATPRMGPPASRHFPEDYTRRTGRRIPLVNNASSSRWRPDLGDEGPGTVLAGAGALPEPARHSSPAAMPGICPSGLTVLVCHVAHVVCCPVGPKVWLVSLMPSIREVTTRGRPSGRESSACGKNVLRGLSRGAIRRTAPPFYGCLSQSLTFSLACLRSALTWWRATPHRAPAVPKRLAP